MNVKKVLVLASVLLSVSAYAESMEANGMHNKLIIAHRGASGYLPEHTLESKALAFAQGADYLEQDLAMSKDGRLIVIHDQSIVLILNPFPFVALTQFSLSLIHCNQKFVNILNLIF